MKNKKDTENIRSFELLLYLEGEKLRLKYRRSHIKHHQLPTNGTAVFEDGKLVLLKVMPERKRHA